jgi:cytochrome c oxidase subunit 3
MILINNNRLDNDSFTEKLGLIILIGSLSMFFITLFASYGILRVKSIIWQVNKIEGFLFYLSCLNTFIIITSSFIYYYFSKKPKEKSIAGVKITLLFGVVFLLLQLILWSNLVSAGYTIQSNQSSSIFYLLSGVHFLHVIIGIIALLWLINKYNKFNNIHKEINIIGMYWHFLMIVWILIFLSVILY